MFRPPSGKGCLPKSIINIGLQWSGLPLQMTEESPLSFFPSPRAITWTERGWWLESGQYRRHVQCHTRRAGAGTKLPRHSGRHCKLLHGQGAKLGFRSETNDYSAISTVCVQFQKAHPAFMHVGFTSQSGLTSSCRQEMSSASFSLLPYNYLG